MMKRKQDTSFRVEAASELMSFLLSKLGGMTRTSVKQLLSQRRVTVNAGIQTRHDTPLKPGDVVQINQGRGNVELRHPKLRVIYEDDALIVVEKKNGLLTVPYNPKSSETTAYSILKDYLYLKAKIFSLLFPPSLLPSPLRQGKRQRRLWCLRARAQRRALPFPKPLLFYLECLLLYQIASAYLS